MSGERPNPAGPEEEWSDVLVACLEAVESGHGVERQALLARYPEFATQLAEFFAHRDQIERLASPLRSAVQAGLTAGAVGFTEDTPRPLAAGNAPSWPGETLGGYELLEQLGHGGMGVVYKAQQRGTNRLVALKTVRTTDLMSAAAIQRFRNEAEIVATLDHPHVVPLYEVAEQDGWLYFSMKLIEGGSLNSCLPRFAADPRAAARLVLTVARAVHHAHQRGILHRDLKPSNVLLDVDGQPHVTDFGLAKRLETDSEVTQSGAIVGTPSYMAPEQGARRKGAVTTATDVYGVGAILYALVTGQPPFRGETVLETLEQVQTREPEPPSRGNRLVDRDLETICLKCLEKDPLRRYSSAEALAEDLDRWLRDEPIQARPVGQVSRLWRWCRRNQLVAALAVTTALLLVASVVGLALSVVLIDRERKEALRQRDAAREGAELVREHLYAADVSRAHDAWRKVDLPRARELLARHWPRDGQEDLRSFEWFYLWRLERRVLSIHEQAVYHVRFSHDGNYLGSASQEGIVNLVDLRTGKSVASVNHGPEANWVDFSSDGCLLTTTGDDGNVRVWDRKSGMLLLTLAGHSGEAVAAVFLPDGTTIASGGQDKLIKFWDVRTGQVVATLVGHTDRIEWLGVTPDGKTLASVRACQIITFTLAIV